MNTKDWNSNEKPHIDKPLDSFRADEVNGEEILGGGKGSVIIPTADGSGDGLGDGTTDDGTAGDGSSGDSILG